MCKLFFKPDLKWFFLSSSRHKHHPPSRNHGRRGRPQKSEEADDSQLPRETEQEEETDNEATRGVTIPLLNGSESRSVIAKRLKGWLRIQARNHNRWPLLVLWLRFQLNTSLDPELQKSCKSWGQFQRKLVTNGWKNQPWTARIYKM